MKKTGKSQSNLIAKECIVTALLQLIYEKPLSAITISELTLRAGVSRVTFYRNYESKEDVFVAELQEILERYEKEDLPEGTPGIYYDRQHMIHCFRYFSKYRSFMDALVYCGFGDMFLRSLTEYIQKKWADDTLSQTERYRLAAFSGMLYNIYAAWVQGGCRETPEQIADIIEGIYLKS